MKRWRFNGASFIVALLIFVVSISAGKCSAD